MTISAEQSLIALFSGARVLAVLACACGKAAQGHCEVEEVFIAASMMRVPVGEAVSPKSRTPVSHARLGFIGRTRGDGVPDQHRKSYTRLLATPN